MKRIFLLLLICVPLYLSAQQDPEAKKILDQVSAKVKSCQSIQANFELTIENKKDNKTSTSKGLIKIKGDKYYMESMGTKVFFNGKTLWSFMEDINEVTISEPDQTDDDFVENPAKIFTFYNRDFKYHLVGESRIDEGWTYEIDLFPMTLNQPYSRIKLYVGKDNMQIYLIKAIAKEGINYSAYIRNAKFDQPISDSFFQFQPEKYKGIEIVDLR